MIGPDEYALVVGKALKVQMSATAVPGELEKVFYEIRIGDRLVERVEKDAAIAFIDGVIAGFNLAANR